MRSISWDKLLFVLTFSLLDDLIRLGGNENINPKKDCRLDTFPHRGRLQSSAVLAFEDSGDNRKPL